MGHADALAKASPGPSFSPSPEPSVKPSKNPLRNGALEPFPEPSVRHASLPLSSLLPTPISPVLGLSHHVVTSARLRPSSLPARSPPRRHSGPDGDRHLDFRRGVVTGPGTTELCQCAAFGVVVALCRGCRRGGRSFICRRCWAECQSVGWLCPSCDRPCEPPLHSPSGDHPMSVPDWITLDEPSGKGRLLGVFALA